MTASRLRPERRVDSHNQVATYQCGDRIFAEGSEGDEFFIVITGLVGLSKEVDGTQKELHRIGPGEIFGEIAVISSAPRSASAIALEPDTSVIAVDKARFLYLVGQHFGFAVLVMQTLSRWLRNKGDDPDVASPTAELNERMRTGAPCTAVPIEDDVWQLRSRSRSCNSYLFKGRDRTVLIDAGLNAGFEALAACLISLDMHRQRSTRLFSPMSISTTSPPSRVSPAVGSLPRTVWPRTRSPMAMTSPSCVALSAKPRRTSPSRWSWMKATSSTPAATACACSTRRATPRAASASSRSG